MMPLLTYSATFSGLTSGTTKGMSSSYLNCEVLSITTHPAAAAMGAYFSEIEAPGENKPICALEKSNVAKSSTLNEPPLKGIRLPTELLLARA